MTNSTITNEMLYELIKEFKADMKEFKADVNRRFTEVDRRFEEQNNLIRENKREIIDLIREDK